ncbi:MAG: hypothetical protein AB8C84_01825 [Oligoflexales bacterium]
MGRNYLIAIILMYLGSYILTPISKGAESIQFPPTPRPTLPPPPESNIFSKDLDRMRKRRLNREEMENYVDWGAKITEELKIEAEKIRDMEFMTQISLLYPFIFTTGKRENYNVDLTSHIMSLYKISNNSNPYQEHFWVGVRIAPFAGYGVQDSAPGRYGLYFFGPAIAWGKVGELIRKKNDLPTREGSLFSVGLSPAFTSGQKDGATEENPSDFLNQKAPTIDIPALWFEYSDLTVHYGGLGFHWVLGAQIGSEKTFAWFGIATSGWL